MPVSCVFLLDIFVGCQFVYWRTYYTAIPWNSYFLGGNLADFMGSVYASVRWCDGLFFAMTLGLLFYTSRYGICCRVGRKRNVGPYGLQRAS